MIEITAKKSDEGKIRVLNIENCKTVSELPDMYDELYDCIYLNGEGGIGYCGDFFCEKYLSIGCEYDIEEFKERIDLITEMEKKLKEFKTM